MQTMFFLIGRRQMCAWIREQTGRWQSTETILCGNESITQRRELLFQCTTLRFFITIIHAISNITTTTWRQSGGRICGRGQIDFGRKWGGEWGEIFIICRGRSCFMLLLFVTAFIVRMMKRFVRMNLVSREILLTSGALLETIDDLGWTCGCFRIAPCRWWRLS